MIVKLSAPKQYLLKLAHGNEDVLPLPLSEKEEQQLLDTYAKERDLQVKSCLIEHNLRLVVFIVKKFANTEVWAEDLISTGTIGLIKAINTFDQNKQIKLSTYASRCIKNEILMYLRQNRRKKMEVPINELLYSGFPETVSYEICKEMEAEEEHIQLTGAIEALSERERRIIQLRFGIDDREGKYRTQKEVADLLGISQSYMSRLEKRILGKLRREIAG